MGRSTAQIAKARQLAIDGHKDEAEKLLKEVLDISSPGQSWHTMANNTLKQLDKLVELGVRQRKGK